jgi:2-oxoglutarate ferredoxin oxidoreductase subunit alpha
MIPLTLPYTVKIKGRAGDGIISTGDMLLLAISHYGLYGSVYREYPSNIQGGNAAVTIRISDTPSPVPIFQIDCLFISFINDAETEIFNCAKNAVLIFDSSHCTKSELQSLLEKYKYQNIQLLPVSLKKVSEEYHGNKYRSSMILGLIGKYLSIPFSHLEYAVEQKFTVKNPSLIQKTIGWVSNGYQINPPEFCPVNSLPAPIVPCSELVILDGNELIAIGALVSGCKFFASYPITPSIGIGNYLARKLPQYGGVAYQAEDEIAAIGAAIGASFAGVKSMVATSGPGLSLMQEFLGYGSMVELPLVVIDVQRPGPSTGSPSQFAQEDLFAVVCGTHGETSRIVLAPSSIENCYFTTIDAFNCAEVYQCPVIVLSDSGLGLTKLSMTSPESTNVNCVERDILCGDNLVESRNRDTTSDMSEVHLKSADEEYQRYSLAGMTTPIPVPGYSPVSYRVTGLEHDEYGRPTESPEMRTLQHQRRANKTSTVESRFPSLVEWDCLTAEVDFGVMAWGMTAIITKHVVEMLRNDGIRIAAVYPRLLFPVCTDSIRRLQELTSIVIIPECNEFGQYARIVRMFTDLKPHSILSFNGSPFMPEVLYTNISSLFKKKL